MMQGIEAGDSSRKRLKPGERKLQILQAMALMLEQESEKVTTAGLASRLQVSEAALYRHFASKAQMYEGLLEFIEQTIFGLINQIDAENDPPQVRARSIVLMLLNFAETNPGMTRVLTGEALAYENLRLQQRVNQLLDRTEASLRQCLKLQLAQSDGTPPVLDPALQASLVMGFVLGRWLRFSKTAFRARPSESAEAILLALFP
ncbi:MAG: nucleoid occlusion factor SlmA [Burkholderiaceae bacterium]